MLSEPAAVEHLRGRGIKSLPVTIIDDTEVIIGYYPKKLIPALKLDVSVDLSGKTFWLSEKYDAIMSAAVRATQQFSQEQLDAIVPWRPWSLRDTMVHIVSFPEVAYMSHEVGSMSWDDMQASDERLKGIVTAPAIAEYGLKVRDDIKDFMANGSGADFDREVPAHYGGEVTVLELMNIVLSHSTHHLKQIYHYMRNDLAMTIENPATDADLDGIQTPDALI